MKNQTDVPLDLDALLAGAVAAARAAGRHALRHRRRRREVALRFDHDVKLILDRECQAVAERVIRRRFPRHGILGEEDRRARPPADMRWIIDPIDGTVNFFHGLPLWCSSVAVQVRGRTVAGAVFAPEMEACYTARAGRPALCNGKPIAVSSVSRLSAAVIATGIAKEAERGPRSCAMFRKLCFHAQKMRIMGSAALDICQVASGNIDGFYEAGIYLWDMAAGGLIAEQAGGRSEILAARPGHRVTFLASNGRIHAAVKKVLGATP